MTQLDFSSLIIQFILFIGLIVVRFTVKKPNRYLIYMILSAIILFIEITSTDYKELLDTLIIIQQYNVVLSTAVSMLIVFFYLIFITLIVYSYRMYKKNDKRTVKEFYLYKNSIKYKNFILKLAIYDRNKNSSSQKTRAILILFIKTLYHIKNPTLTKIPLLYIAKLKNLPSGKISHFTEKIPDPEGFIYQPSALSSLNPTCPFINNGKRKSLNFVSS